MELAYCDNTAKEHYDSHIDIFFVAKDICCLFSFYGAVSTSEIIYIWTQ